ncbi:Fic family protein [Kingella negevensis]|uniref:Fic family protein n=1 Tax=Kingella negevensis TaxID=1522312 RepID=UPI002542ACD0|nr:Fic family protein [Kingella negevensis]WII93199.1 Fic family protein [Kingella negevensis]
MNNSNLDDTFRKLEKENYLKDIGIDNFSERAAFYMGEINAAHPFREGNGRTMREFISQLTKTNNYKISWDNINQEDMIKTSIHSMNGDNRFLANLIRENTVQTNKTEKLSATELFAKMAATAVKKGEAVTIHKPVEQAQIKPKQGGEAQTETQLNKQKTKIMKKGSLNFQAAFYSFIFLTYYKCRNSHNCGRNSRNNCKTFAPFMGFFSSSRRSIRSNIFIHNSFL